MPLDPQLLEILACPQDKGPLYYLADEDALYNPRLKCRYAVREGIPVLLADESDKVADGEHARIMAKVEAQGLQPTFAPAGPGAGGEPGPAAGRD
ncbi:MAG: Trm112 family protein [Actinomycetota bacterium]|nr:Trm112 family protein [Actinomycetota bacterium]